MMNNFHFPTFSVKMLLVAIGFVICGSTAFAGDKGHQIEIKINNLEAEQVYFAVHYGNKQFIKDTLDINSKGLFVKEGDEPLEGGVYLVILPPENNYFELLIGNEKDQFFSVETTKPDMIGTLKAKGSEENVHFYEYLNFVSGQRKLVGPLNEQLEKAKGNEKQSKKIKEQMAEIDEKVQAFQKEFVQKYPNSLGAAIVKSSLETETPAPDEKLSEEEKQAFQFNFYKAHFFDNIDISDNRLLRSPILLARVERYLDKLTYQIPDSLMVAVDYILEKAKGDEETFKYFVVHCLNKYARSKVVGLDAVYVHIADTYYATGLAPWTEEDQIKKILKNARQLKPLLLGKKAPNIKITTIEDDKKIQLYDVEADYTIVYFWDPNCGHCKKQAPLMMEAFNKYKDKKVVLFSVCTKDKAKEECVKSIEEKKLENWLHTMAAEDSELYYRVHYNIRSTPQMYILDKDKIIKSKGLGAEQLEEVLEMLMKMEREKGQG